MFRERQRNYVLLFGRLNMYRTQPIIKYLNTFDHKKYCTTQEAAKALHMAYGSVRNMLCRGALTTYKLRSLTLVSIQEIKQYRKRNQ